MGNLRRSRGYSFETYLVKKFIEHPDWCARRLGGASTGLPDLIAVNNKQSILYAIEAKSKRANSVDVPIDEIQRCRDIIRFFGEYRRRYVVVAARLGENKRPQYGYWDIFPYDHITKVTVKLAPIHIIIEHKGGNTTWTDYEQLKMPWQKD